MMLKKIFLLTSILLLGALSASAHNVKMAVFDLCYEDSTEAYVLRVRVDREDIEAVLGETANIKNLDAYLRQHVGLKLEGEEAVLEAASGFFIDKLYVEIKFPLRLPANVSTDAEMVEFSTDLLLEEHETQRNLLTLRLHDKRRTFKCDKDRLSVTARY